MREGDQEFHPAQVEAWRRMSSEQKWALARSARRMVVDAARRRLARQHPDWDPVTLERELCRFLIRSHT